MFSRNCHNHVCRERNVNYSLCTSKKEIHSTEIWKKFVYHPRAGNLRRKSLQCQAQVQCKRSFNLAFAGRSRAEDGVSSYSTHFIPKWMLEELRSWLLRLRFDDDGRKVIVRKSVRRRHIITFPKRCENILCQRNIIKSETIKII